MPEYIEKQALYEKIAELEELARNRVCDTPGNSPAYMRYVTQQTERTQFKHLIADFPAADVAPVVHGNWKWFEELDGNPETGYDSDWGWKCSECHLVLPDDFDDPNKYPGIPYCYNCGAKMDLE